MPSNRPLPSITGTPSNSERTRISSTSRSPASRPTETGEVVMTSRTRTLRGRETARSAVQAALSLPDHHDPVCHHLLNTGENPFDLRRGENDLDLDGHVVGDVEHPMRSDLAVLEAPCHPASDDAPRGALLVSDHVDDGLIQRRPVPPRFFAREDLDDRICHAGHAVPLVRSGVRYRCRSPRGRRPQCCCPGSSRRRAPSCRPGIGSPSPP